MLKIRKEQMGAFSFQALESFEDRIVARLNTFSPDHCQALGEEKTRKAIRYGIKRAASYGIEFERDVCLYIDQMFAFGQDFDKDPNLPWAAEILTDETIFGPTSRIDKLHETSLRHVREAAGIQDDQDNE